MSTVHAKKLHKAIAALPGASGQKGKHERFALFVQSALMSLWKAHENRRASQGDTTATIFPKVFGFTSKDSTDWAALSLPLAETFKAYFAAVMESEPFHDVLGDLFEEMDLADRSMGQFLTPTDLADLTGAISAEHLKRHPPTLQDGTFSIYDPAVGAGGLLLGHFRQYDLIGWPVPFAQFKVVANDLDPLCSAVTALQLLANVLFHRKHFASVRITVGNALQTEQKVGMFYGCVPIEKFTLRALGKVA